MLRSARVTVFLVITPSSGWFLGARFVTSPSGHHADIQSRRRWRHRSPQFDRGAVTHELDVPRTAAVMQGTSTYVGSREDGKMKQGRRVAPRDKISRRRRTSGFDAAASDVGDDFPHDDFAPDDLPVRDVSEDQDEPQPAPRVRTKGPGRPVDALNKTIRGREGEGVAPALTHIVGQHRTPLSTKSYLLR